MPTKTLRRPQRIPPRDTHVGRNHESTGRAGTESVATPIVLRRVNQLPRPGPADAVPHRVDDPDPLAGLTRAQRQALRKAPTRKAPAARAPRRHRGQRLVGDILFVTLLATVLWFTWPVRFGGHATFVVVHGHSMDPTFRSGDLVLTRSQSSYRVGDIAAYRIPKGQAGAGHGVIHRIVATEGDHYVFKGDNRTTQDQWRPKATDIIGRLLLRIPLPGETFWALLPWIWCAAVGVVVMWMFWPQRATHRPRETAT